MRFNTLAQMLATKPANGATAQVKDTGSGVWSEYIFRENASSLTPSGSDILASTFKGRESLDRWVRETSQSGDIDLIKAYFDTVYSTMTYTAPASVTPTFTGFGTVSGVNCYTWRMGAYLHYEYRWTNGTVTGTEASASLRYNPGSGEVTVTSASSYPTLQIVGNGATSAGPVAGGTGSGNTVVLAEASKTYVTLGAQIDGIIAGLSKRAGDAYLNSAVMSIRGAVRIQGW